MKMNKNESELKSKQVLAANLKYYIDKSGKTANQIAKEIGMAHSYMYDLLKGKKQPSFEMLEKIASYFSVEVADLLKNR